MSGKRVLITGARNKWSIGWHCALSMAREGARPVFSVYSEREQDDVRKLLRAEEMPDCPVFVCDATKLEDVDSLISQVGAAFDGELDGLLHAMAFAKREELIGEFIKVSQDGFALANDASVYTL